MCMTYKGLTAVCFMTLLLWGNLLQSADQPKTPWKISGEHLELYDRSGAMVARFEARYPK